MGPTVNYYTESYALWRIKIIQDRLAEREAKMGKAYDVLDESKNKIVEREKNEAKRRYELTSNAAKSLSEFLASVCCCR